MTLNDHQKLLLEAASNEVLQAGQAWRNPHNTAIAQLAAKDRYNAAVSYLHVLLRKLEGAQHATTP